MKMPCYTGLALSQETLNRAQADCLILGARESSLPHGALSSFDPRQDIFPTVSTINNTAQDT